MSKEELNHIVYSRNVIEFVTVAKEYCTYIESHASYSRKDFLKKMQLVLPLLYLKMSLIPALSDENAAIPGKFVTEVDYSFLLNRLSTKFGQYDSYKEVFDPGMQFSEEALSSSISENLCDIYQDTKDFIMAFRIGTPEIMTGALWECQNNFETYWGQKLVNGLRAIHAVIYNNIDENGEEEAPLIMDEPDENNKKSWVSKHFDNYSDQEGNIDNEL
jgi:hypothetical protein